MFIDELKKKSYNSYIFARVSITQLRRMPNFFACELHRFPKDLQITNVCNDTVWICIIGKISVGESEIA